jgi:hypothetical protein
MAGAATIAFLIFAIRAYRRGGLAVTRHHFQMMPITSMLSPALGARLKVNTSGGEAIEWPPATQ